MLSDKTKEFIKEHEQTHGKTLYKLENGKKKAVSRWIDSIDAEIACEIEKKETVKYVCELLESELKRWSKGNNSCEAKYRIEMIPLSLAMMLKKLIAKLNE